MIFPGYHELHYHHANLLSASAQGKICIGQERFYLGGRSRLERDLEVERNGNHMVI